MRSIENVKSNFELFSTGIKFFSKPPANIINKDLRVTKILCKNILNFDNMIKVILL